jgi:hypothetical protein
MANLKAMVGAGSARWVDRQTINKAQRAMAPTMGKTIIRT